MACASSQIFLTGLEPVPSEAMPPTGSRTRRRLMGTPVPGGLFNLSLGPSPKIYELFAGDEYFSLPPFPYARAVVFFSSVDEARLMTFVSIGARRNILPPISIFSNLLITPPRSGPLFDFLRRSVPFFLFWQSSGAKFFTPPTFSLSSR